MLLAVPGIQDPLKIFRIAGIKLTGSALTLLPACSSDAEPPTAGWPVWVPSDNSIAASDWAQLAWMPLGAYSLPFSPLDGVLGAFCPLAGEAETGGTSGIFGTGWGSAFSRAVTCGAILLLNPATMLGILLIFSSGSSPAGVTGDARLYHCMAALYQDQGRRQFSSLSDHKQSPVS